MKRGKPPARAKAARKGKGKAKAKGAGGAALRISAQEGFVPGESLAEKIELMLKWGIEGLEPGGGIVGNEKRYIDALEGSGVSASAICWGSVRGDLVSEDPAKRGPAAEEFRRVISSAGEIGSTGVIYVPAFNGQTALPNPEIREILVDTLPALGEHALACGTRVLLEPLNRNEAYFLRQLADAAAIARDCASDGVCVMGDFYHMCIEETSDRGAFISAGARLHHVHLASRERVLPGQDDRSFVDGFRGLRDIGYRDFCSFECGCRGDRMAEIPKAVAFLKKQWAEAGG